MMNSIYYKSIFTTILVSLIVISCNTPNTNKTKVDNSVSETEDINTCEYELNKWEEHLKNKDLKKIKTIDLEFQCVDYFPKEIFEMEQLNSLSMNVFLNVSTIPQQIGNLKSLDTLSISKSNIDSLPNEIGNLNELKYLFIAGGGKLKSIPSSIGNCEELVELNLWRNSLTTLPESIKNLKKLRILNLIENDISESERKRIKKLLPNCMIKFEY